MVSYDFKDVYSIVKSDFNHRKEVVQGVASFFQQYTRDKFREDRTKFFEDLGSFPEDYGFQMPSFELNECDRVRGKSNICREISNTDRIACLESRLSECFDEDLVKSKIKEVRSEFTGVNDDYGWRVLETLDSLPADTISIKDFSDKEAKDAAIYLLTDSHFKIHFKEGYSKLSKEIKAFKEKGQMNTHQGFVDVATIKSHLEAMQESQRNDLHKYVEQLFNTVPPQEALDYALSFNSPITAIPASVMVLRELNKEGVKND